MAIKYFNNVLIMAGICMVISCKNELQTLDTSREKYRPVFHFTPPTMWMNDPNGMVYYEGEYHLFYQHYPDSTVWGPMHWGHAVSRDLVNWEHLPIALYPDSLGMIFSGSAVVDWNNTSGFGKDGLPPLVAIFTQHDAVRYEAGRNDFQYQSIAWSNDKGRTWSKYSGNPVIPNTMKIKDFRDPKVIWYEAGAQWIMVFAAHDHVMFWGSPDLKHWTHLSDFGKEWGGHDGVWECPNLLPMKVEETGEVKWVLLQSLNPGGPNGGSGTQYFVGDFDGKNFTLDPEFQQSVAGNKGIWLDWGRDNYAGVTWSDIPASDGRTIFLGWMSNWDYATVVPTQRWRSAMTIPRSLVLHKTSDGLRLYSQPVKELGKLRRDSTFLTDVSLSGSMNLTEKLNFSPVAMEADMTFELPDNGTEKITVVLSNEKGEEYRFGYDPVQKVFFSDRTKAGGAAFSAEFAQKIHTAPAGDTGKLLRMHVFIDVASSELFVDNGRLVLTDIFFPTTEFTQISINTAGKPIKLKEGRFYALK